MSTPPPPSSSMRADNDNEKLRKRKSIAIAPLALSSLVRIISGEKYEEDKSPKSGLQRTASLPRVSRPLSNLSPEVPPRATTPNIKSPRMCASPLPSPRNRVRPGGGPQTARMSHLAALSIGDESQAPAMGAPLARGRSERSGVASPRSASSPVSSPRSMVGDFRRHSSVGGASLNKKPILIRCMRDPLGVASACDLFYVPIGKMTMEHRQIISLGQPADERITVSGKKRMDEYSLVREIQMLRQRASFLLTTCRSRLPISDETRAEIGMESEEGKYAEYAAAPDWTPPSDESKYEVITIVSPTGF